VIPDAQGVHLVWVARVQSQGQDSRGFGAFQEPPKLSAAQRSVLPALAADLAGYEGTKGSLHFPVDQPLPPALVNKLVTTRLRELGL